MDYSYAPQSNRLNQKGKRTVILDAAGNTIDDGKYQYRYDAAGRLSQVRWHHITVARYRYDYRGLRRQKTTMTGTTQFTYSPNGHLLSEQGAWGYRGRDYVWSDTSPIAQIDARGIGHRRDRIDYLHSDAMGTPRLATNKKQQIVWKWRWDAFGASQIIKGRNAHTRIKMNLRYPGQYYDQETRLFYNWNRYYDPSTGRYVRSDPLGLRGGSNSYLYADGMPLVKTDRKGLAPCPGGYWNEGFGDFGLSAQFGGYISAANVNLVCRSRPTLQCHAKQVCIGGGPGAQVGAGVTLGGDANNLFDSNNLSGWGHGV